jgi:tripartite-type tricarboxylate transporter receptor subunit TctC
MKKENLLGLAGALAGCGLLATAAMAQEDVAAFYKDKQIRLVVGSAAGSGYDLNARLLAKYFQRHIPGKPTIVIQNQPGAGSAIMANALYNAAPRDGTVMGAAINGMPTLHLFSPDKARYDPTKFLWLGSTNRDTQVSYVWHTAPVQSLADLQKKELVVGATTPGTTQVDYPLVARAIFGLKFKLTSGYQGTTDIHLAMERGEVQGMGANGYLSLKVLKSDWIANKQVKIIMQYGEEKNPDLPDVPSIFSLAKTDADKQAMRLMVSRLDYGRPFFLPPGVPEARVAALRHAFDETMKDKDYLAEAKKEKIEVSPLSGQDVAKLIEQDSHTPAAVVERVSKALAAGGK